MEHFDKVLSEHAKTLTQGRKMELEILLREIKDFGYTTFSHLHGAIQSHLDLIKEKEGE